MVRARPPLCVAACAPSSFPLLAVTQCERCDDGQAAAEERAAGDWRLRAWYNRKRMRRRHKNRAGLPPPRLCRLASIRAVRCAHLTCPPTAISLCPPRRCIVVGFWPANGRAAPRRRRTVTSQSPCRRRAANPSSPLVHLRPLRNRRCGTARGPHACACATRAPRCAGATPHRHHYSRYRCCHPRSPPRWYLSVRGCVYVSIL